MGSMKPKLKKRYFGICNKGKQYFLTFEKKGNYKNKLGKLCFRESIQQLILK